MSLKNAPKHIQLAVDLIQLLEENQMQADTVVKALAIVQQDFQRKLEAETTDITS
ncbi:pleiotropic regulatory protein RsmS [Moritella sp. F3]|uniref:pleiotropic regulatory protein RsmS n=1 Tax=Moritella sp. F3 TaxID=2718882 RepID=UPI0018E1A002|nr:pleiotropic regulatory protein RsmS [Moritella sp. F3]GIC75720.1 DUF2496 domain-containing protein [Moritella sp. F1]GIC81832.1 DUF2496 domain-containing protein [Moritella sp. F3]